MGRVIHKYQAIQMSAISRQERGWVVHENPIVYEIMNDLYPDDSYCIY